MSKKVIHIISHSHWDREWYMPFEKHRLKLVKLMDECMELFEQSQDFKSFHLDGQTIVLDDYLEIKPENIDKLKENVVNERFHIGPWYILQDEFLVSGEASVRNLLVGIEEARKYGKVCKIGYFPDAFGNAGQMPQLLKQAGMEAVVFGRGVKPIGFNNEVTQTGNYESFYSEMIWNSPDGSGLPGILFANWYNNGAEIPVDEEKAKQFWDQRLKDSLRYASTDHLLFMNGCDHQPVQKDIGAAIEVAGRLYPEYEFRHSNFPDYITCVKEDQERMSLQGKELSTVTGELTSQATDGWTTLVNTTSSRVYLKQLNRENEVLLTNLAEPMAVFAADCNQEYPHSELTYAWKMLMQNHPHDSICGCSVDEVHEEMVTRYHKSMQVGNEIVAKSLEGITSQIDTSRFQDGQAYPFTVWNTSGWERTGVISVTIDLKREYSNQLHLAYQQLKEEAIESYLLTDEEGHPVACTIEDMGVRFGYDLPGDKFRQPYMARFVKVTFEAKAVPSMGYRVYALVPGREEEKAAEQSASLIIDKGLENQYIKVTINENGTLNLLHKDSNRLYEGICYYEDTGDIGNEYIYRQAKDDRAILSKDFPCNITLEEDCSYRGSYRITQVLDIPVSADETLTQERSGMIDIRYREAGRSGKLEKLTLQTVIRLEQNSHALQITTEFENTMKDHRLRLILPTGIQAYHHYADSAYEVVTRPNVHADTWANPSGCEHQQCFAGIEDDRDGLLVSNFGLYEYELLAKEENAIAITLLRAVGEMGDWGVFPTPGAQCIRTCTATLNIIPYAVEDKTFDPVALAYQNQMRLLSAQTMIHEGSLPLIKSYLTWEGEQIYLTGMKNKEKSDHTILRWINASGQERNLRIKNCDSEKGYYLSNVIEEKLMEVIPDVNQEILVTLRPHEIFTLGIVQ